MDKFYSENVLIRYYYKEADFFETLEVEHALENDSRVKSLFNKLSNLFEELPKAKFVPTQNTIDQILFASRNTELLA